MSHSNWTAAGFTYTLLRWTVPGQSTHQAFLSSMLSVSNEYQQSQAVRCSETSNRRGP